MAQHSSQPHGIDGLFPGTETVLVIEDELVVRQRIAETLQHQRYTILSAPNEVAAVEVIEGHSGLIDLLLTDMVMPIMGGQELAEMYHIAYPDGRALYMSGYPDTSVSDQGVLEPDCSFLHKPVTLPELTLKVRQPLDRQPKTGAAVSD